MTMIVRLMSVTGKFRTVDIVSVSSTAEAKAAVEKHASLHGFSDVRIVDDEVDGARFTATTPNGRKGRNIAYLDYKG